MLLWLMGYQFNEFRQQTIDFGDESLVAEYDSKQQASVKDGRALIKDFGLNTADTVIEFGPGTGALSVAMAEVCKHVYAVDTSQAMLAYIRKSAEAYSLDNITVHHAGFLSYKHDADPVDFIVTKFAFHHLPDMWKAIALAKFNRMLKPLGRFYLHDVIFSFQPEAYEGAIDAWIDEVTQYGGWSRSEFEVHVNEEYSTFAWILEGLVQRAGFRIIKTHYWSQAYGSILCEKVRELTNDG